jgi:hypothetical protein
VPLQLCGPEPISKQVFEQILKASVLKNRLLVGTPRLIVPKSAGGYSKCAPRVAKAGPFRRKKYKALAFLSTLASRRLFVRSKTWHHAESGILVIPRPSNKICTHLLISNKYCTWGGKYDPHLYSSCKWVLRSATSASGSTPSRSLWMGLPPHPPLCLSQTSKDRSQPAVGLSSPPCKKAEMKPFKCRNEFIWREARSSLGQPDRNLHIVDTSFLAPRLLLSSTTLTRDFCRLHPATKRVLNSGFVWHFNNI